MKRYYEITILCGCDSFYTEAASTSNITFSCIFDFLRCSQAVTSVISEIYQQVCSWSLVCNILLWDNKPRLLSFWVNLSTFFNINIKQHVVQLAITHRFLRCCLFYPRPNLLSGSARNWRDKMRRCHAILRYVVLSVDLITLKTWHIRLYRGIMT